MSEKEVDYFCKNFGSEFSFEPKRIGKRFFIKDNVIQDPIYFGEYIGEIRKKNFVPSVFLLERIKSVSKKIIVDDKAAWLFVCGRDIMGNSVISGDDNKGYVLVCDKDKNVLGYGKVLCKIDKNNKVCVKNLFDIGDFLRRER